MIEKIKSMILELCKGKDWDWRGHVESVVHYSLLLADKLDGDKEILELAAWLHDITKIRTGEKNHEVSGAEEAGRILNELGYAPDKIDKVKGCILKHPSDKEPPPETKEEKIFFVADALAHFDHFLDFAYSSFVLRKMSVKETRERLSTKYDKYWKKANLIPEAAELVKDKYEAIKLILRLP